LKQINEIKDFLLTARRGRDAHSVKIKRSKDMFKFKGFNIVGFGCTTCIVIHEIWTNQFLPGMIQVFGHSDLKA
ncbi:hypothetical protein RYX36_007173, partial [Vicia faba]